MTTTDHNSTQPVAQGHGAAHAGPPGPAGPPGDGIDSRSLTIVGLFGVILTYVLMVGVQVLFYRMDKADHLRKVVKPGYQERIAIERDWAQTLGGYRWVDAGHKEATVPIDQAMNEVVRSLAAGRH